MAFIPEPGDKRRQRMTVPADGLLGPSRRLMSIEVQSNQVLCVHDNSSLVSGEADALNLGGGRIWLQNVGFFRRS